MKKDFLGRLLRIQFVKFCITGGLGLITDMAVFSVLKSSFQVESRLFLNIIPVFGYIAAVSQNYIINHYWTFGDQTVDISMSRKAYAGFFIVSLIALIPRYIAYNSVIGYLGTGGFHPHFANFIGILVATIFNFIGSKYFVFTGKEE